MTQLDLLRHANDVLTEMSVSFMVVGSLASSAYGEARFTNDIDIAVWLELEDIPVLRRAFPEPEYYFDELTARETVREGGMFNVIHGGSGNKIDFMVSPRDMWSREQFWRRERLEVFPGLFVDAASPEDIIVSKLRYYDEGRSQKHLDDISNMLRVSTKELDRDHIAKWARHFKVMEIWQRFASA